METTKFQINKEAKFPKNITKPIHFIALGGIGMSGLAKFLLELGFQVTGSDIKDGPSMYSISGQGGTVFIGHDAKNVGDAGAVVVSSAIKTDNPELIEAQKRNIPIMHRSQLLSALMDGLGLENPSQQVSIGVSGTHGKTTTSGMLGLVLEHAKLNPSIVVGGQMPVLNTNSKFGNGNYFVAELDESDGTIEFYTPNYTIITNLELDHHDHYQNGLEQLMGTFVSYIEKLDTNSKVIINGDDAGNRDLLSRVDKNKVILYSIDETSPLFASSQYTAKNIKLDGFVSSADVYNNNELLGTIKIQVPGIHNISNALSVVAVGVENNIPFEKIVSALNVFTGMKRRFQGIGEVDGIKIFDDYAHHPTEIIATLKSAKQIVSASGTGRVVAIFQPHRYTRFSSLWNEFLASFADADVVYAVDVYSAGDNPIENVNSEKFCADIDHKNAKYVGGTLEEVSEVVSKELKSGDIVLTIGAGTITKLGTLLLEKLNVLKGK